MLYWIYLLRISLGNLGPKSLIAVLLLALVILVAIGWGLIGLLVVALRSRKKVCPYCSSQRVRPSWIRGKDRYVPWFRPLRCESCLGRFYVLRKFDPIPDGDTNSDIAHTTRRRFRGRRIPAKT